MIKHLEDIVITSILDEEDFILTGSELTDPYRLVFMKMNKAGDIITKKRFGSGPKDYEGHDIHGTQDGYIICGCSEGIASDSGGEDWKAYVLEVDRSGNKIKDRSVRVNGNECFYSINLFNDDILLTGITKKEGKSSSILLTRTDEKFNIKCMNTIGNFEGAMPVDIIRDTTGFKLISSLKTGGNYQIYMHKLDDDCEVLDKELIADGFVLTSEKTADGILLGGKKDGEQYLLGLNENDDLRFERTYKKGKLTYLMAEEDHLLIGGLIEGDDSMVPCLYKTTKGGELICSKIWDKKGLIEDIVKFDERYLVDILLFKDGESTEFIVADELDDIFD
ncbi:MAG: hypothetical protein KGY68_07090 [Candidatus Thermoplasmatota archaeon]|nr:hypothetical protein [Candidatus Thermoplasmatota archaeon]